MRTVLPDSPRAPEITAKVIGEPQLEWCRKSIWRSEREKGWKSRAEEEVQRRPAMGQSRGVKHRPAGQIRTKEALPALPFQQRQFCHCSGRERWKVASEGKESYGGRGQIMEVLPRY